MTAVMCRFREIMGPTVPSRGRQLSDIIQRIGWERAVRVRRPLPGNVRILFCQRRLRQDELMAGHSWSTAHCGTSRHPQVRNQPAPAAQRAASNEVLRSPVDRSKTTCSRQRFLLKQACPPTRLSRPVGGHMLFQGSPIERYATCWPMGRASNLFFSH